MFCQVYNFMLVYGVTVVFIRSVEFTYCSTLCTLCLFNCTFCIFVVSDQEVRLFNCPTGCLTLGDVEAQLVYPRGTEAMYLCKMCKWIFRTRGKFRNHRQFNCAIQRIGNNQLLYSCNICNGLFSRQDLLPKINTNLGTLAVRKPSSYK